MLGVYLSGPTDGPLVILCHGVTDSAASLSHAIGLFNTRYRVAAIDTLGHGISPRLTSDEAHTPFAACVDHLHETVCALTSQYGAAYAVGHSMGGALLTAVAHRCPEAFRAIVLEDPAWLTSEQVAHYAQSLAATIEPLRVHDNQAEVLASNRAEYPTWPEEERLAWLQAKYAVDPHILQAGEVGLLEPWRTICPTLTVPCLLVTSDTDDVLITREHLAHIAQMHNPLISTAIIPGLRHCIRRENPSAFHKRVAAYFDAHR
ncbi:alpha/beta fold hydrolase [Schaalia suimastitidis]|uniref:alpha/beta fold hydrolase n=1 Tax=Schaalia suimastitidis TaxID=121163 RepID=UPI00041278D1|nr:alpha/beta hydrolase [Schaalia suimastitidis]